MDYLRILSGVGETLDIYHMIYPVSKTIELLPPVHRTHHISMPLNWKEWTSDHFRFALVRLQVYADIHRYEDSDEMQRDKICRPDAREDSYSETSCWRPNPISQIDCLTGPSRASFLNHFLFISQKHVVAITPGGSIWHHGSAKYVDTSTMKRNRPTQYHSGNLPDTWKCPVCSAGKDAFEEMESADIHASATVTVSDVIISELAAWGVTLVFGLPGTSSLGLVDAIRKKPCRPLYRRPP